MTGYTREELLVAHEQLADNEDNLIADGGIGTGDSDTSSALHADGGREPPVVTRTGGAKAADPKGAVSDVAHLVTNGTDAVVVHGGSIAVDETLEELGEEPTYIELPPGVSGRFTDERAMEVFSMVMPGKLNTDLTALLREADVDAFDLSGVDGGPLIGPRKSVARVVEDGKKRVKHGDHSGKITSVSAMPPGTFLDDGHTPVVTVPILADDGVPVNADVDRTAAAVAGALGAKLVVLTDVKGVYADPDDEPTLIGTADTPEGFSALESAAEGFMTKKVVAVKEVFDGEAVEVVVADVSLNDPTVMALNGDGTYVMPGVLIEAEGAEQ